jgi:selenocysteine-specific elongation factor
VLIALAAEGIVGRFQNSWYLVDNLAKETATIKETIGQYLKESPHLKGMIIDQLQERSDHAKETLVAIVDYMTTSGELTRVGEFYNLAGRGIALKGVIKEAHDKIIAALIAEPLAPPALQSFASQGKPYQEAIRFIIESREAHKCGAEFLLLDEVWSEVVKFIRRRLTENGSLAVTELRDQFGFSRKYAIPILEESDRLKLTERQGDQRIKGARFDHEEFIL